MISKNSQNSPKICQNSPKIGKISLLQNYLIYGKLSIAVWASTYDQVTCSWYCVFKAYSRIYLIRILLIGILGLLFLSNYLKGSSRTITSARNSVLSRYSFWIYFLPLYCFALSATVSSVKCVSKTHVN